MAEDIPYTLKRIGDPFVRSKKQGLITINDPDTKEWFRFIHRQNTIGTHGCIVEIRQRFKADSVRQKSTERSAQSFKSPGNVRRLSISRAWTQYHDDQY